jgi:hypothetical protein
MRSDNYLFYSLFLCLKYIFENNFKKIKIYYFNVFFNKKYFKKQTLKIKSGHISYIN